MSEMSPLDAHIAAEYDVGKGVTLFTRADNLFDRRYEDPTGFQRPGFGFFAGVRISFDTKPSPAGANNAESAIYSKDNSK